ncbi:MAG: glycosyltransferase [Candidatus Altiarchaeota archaeon]|nr:glycosyltransferase [Candidatus Altiarchaeota archaeon]
MFAELIRIHSINYTMNAGIAQVTKYYTPHRGGMESHIQGISEELAKKGLRVEIYTSNIPPGEGNEEVGGVSVYRSSSWFTLSNGPFTPGLLIQLLLGDYDLVHVHLPDPFNSLYAYLASCSKNKPLVVTYHADIIKKRWFEKILYLLYKPILHLTLGRAEKIITTSETYIEGSSLLERFRDKIDVVPNFVDHHRFNPEVDGSGIREKHNIGNKKMVLFVGRMVEYKGIGYLIEAFRDVRDAVLVVVGDGPLREELVKQASDVKNIIFVHDVPGKELPEYYAACDLFVLSSITRQEAFGITLLEAMASGKPCITTNISGMPYVVGDCGIKITPKNTTALTYAITELLRNDADLKERGGCGRRRVNEQFTKEKVTERTFNIYGDIL